jgi:hypothetical protein
MIRKNKAAKNGDRNRREPMVNRTLTYKGDYMPDKFHTFMRYTESWADTTAGGISYYIYRGNSIYDPYFGAGGDSVYGYDEMAAIYGRYKVFGSSIQVEALNAGTEPLNLFVYPTYFSAVPTFSTSDAAPRCKRAMLNFEAGNSVVINHSARANEFFDNPNDANCSALINANPVEPWHWKIYCKNRGLSALNLHLRVTIRYDVLFSLRNIVDDQDA